MGTGGDAGDVGVVTAYHEVLVDHRVVYAHAAALLDAVLVVVPDAAREACAESKVTGGVLVKQRVVEHDAAVADGAVVGYERTLAEHRCALVHGDHGAQSVLILLGVYLDHLAAFKADGEVFDHNATVGERTGGVDDTLCVASHGACEDLLAGDVRVVGYAAAQGILRTGKEERLRDETDGEVRAV